MMSEDSIKKVAAAIAKDIFEVGDEVGSPVGRIEFKSAGYPDNEKSQGGLCLQALENLIKKSLEKALS